MLLIITSTIVTSFLPVSTLMTLNDLGPPKAKIGVFSLSLQFSAVAHISRVNCDEMGGDRPRQPASRNC